MHVVCGIRVSYVNPKENLIVNKLAMFYCTLYGTLAQREGFLANAKFTFSKKADIKLQVAEAAASQFY